ncbi:diguanylate cyclase domain-containing protein [Synechococcus sp. CBW1006]|uniref:diguanylate cyclase domain-containing protein n=1 Tax=Synechococcus sp. CBW1006 TaxID=1353138 RepID=UPI0018CEF6D3|nr:PleD family two-component system response regulator [Synechococcus sp. CBW1006]QPN65431.1 PleD family two-component system response regulator [Synechococcus sp. CBW1006]
MCDPLNSPQLPPRILIVDDERFNRQLLTTVLQDEGIISTAGGSAEALEAVRMNPPDLILLDVRLPDMDGFEVCRRLKSNQATQDIPVIFITAMNNPEEEARGLHLGAVDYITKPFNHTVVKARVRTQLRLKQQANLLSRYAFHDALTGLANRRAFDRLGEHEWNSCQRQSFPLALILLDVDHFKNYNDHYGHGAGDDCLIAIARSMASAVNRSSDLIARYGGEEFAIVLPETALAPACALAERIRHSVEEQHLPHAASPTAPHVTVSLGVASLVPSGGSRIRDLILQADDCLYRAKRQGRNRVCSRAGGSNSEATADAKAESLPAIDTQP